MEKCSKPRTLQTMVQCIADHAFSFPTTHNHNFSGKAVDPAHPCCYSARVAGSSLATSPRVVAKGELDSPSAFRPRTSLSQGNYKVQNFTGLGGTCIDLQNVSEPHNHASANAFAECDASSIFSNINIFQKLHFQSSNSCCKRFILFDRSGGNRRVFLHPSSMQELSRFAPNLMRLDQTNQRTACPGSIYQTQVKSGPLATGPHVPPLNGPLSSGCSGLDARFVAHKDSVYAACTTLQGMKTVKYPEYDAPFSTDPEQDEGDSSSRVSCAGGNPCNVDSVSSSSHENTEDLDALLSSDDDEVSSTDHSPVGLKSENWSSSSFGSDAGCTSLGKRKRCASRNHDELSDVSYLATAWEESIQVLASADNFGGSRKRNSLPLNVTDCKLANGGMNPSYQSFMSGQSGSVKEARKRKIKRTIKTLRSIIPGGDCLDAAVVLDEAIHYVRSLQHKVQELEVDRSIKVEVDRAVKVRM